MTQTMPARARCGRCRRPLSHCLCAYIPAVPHRTPVLVLQHPDEARHPLNTARLAVLGLRHAELRTGERFPDLDRIIAGAGRAVLLFPAAHDHAPMRTPRPSGRGQARQFQNTAPQAPPYRGGEAPADTAGVLHGVAGPDPPRAQGADDRAPLLIVPDGTWRKARKIVHLNPVLGTLPRLSLPPGEPSEYRVRKAPGGAAVSTIEAIARALKALEPEGDFEPLLRPFRVLVEQQITAMGEEIYRRNYPG